MTVISKTRNKTHVRTAIADKRLSGSYSSKMIEAYELSDITIQADKSLKLTTYTNFSTSTYTWSGLYFGMSIKAAGTWHNCGDAGYTSAVMGDKIYGSQSNTHFKYIDLIEDGIVPAGEDYTISIMLMARVYSGTGHLNSATNLINGDNMGNHGIELEDIMKQNFTSIIVQEKDRWA